MSERTGCSHHLQISLPFLSRSNRCHPQQSEKETTDIRRTSYSSSSGQTNGNAERLECNVNVECETMRQEQERANERESSCGRTICDATSSYRPRTKGNTAVSTCDRRSNKHCRFLDENVEMRQLQQEENSEQVASNCEEHPKVGGGSSDDTTSAHVHGPLDEMSESVASRLSWWNYLRNTASLSATTSSISKSFQVSDNRLALKLYGCKREIEREQARQHKDAPWIIH